MVINLVLNGETVSTQTVKATELQIAKKQALDAAIRARDITISQSLLVTFVVVSDQAKSG